MIELRKQKEKHFHNIIREEQLSIQNRELFLANKKWYSIVRSSRNFTEKWLTEKCPNKKVLDYCCGNGDTSIKIAKLMPCEVIGIDISDTSIRNARKQAEKEGVSRRVLFFVMDSENTSFKDNTFDVIHESGVLHHLDLEKAYSELARILKPDGECICAEALGHNPVIHHYRKRTPHLRTEWEVEHILRKKDIEKAKNFFNKVEILGFFHLTTILAVPFRTLPIFKTFLSTLEALDKVLLKLPLIKWQAWQITFSLSEPIKNSK